MVLQQPFLLSEYYSLKSVAQYVKNQFDDAFNAYMTSEKDAFPNFADSVQKRIQRLLSNKQEMLLNNFVIVSLW